MRNKWFSRIKIVLVKSKLLQRLSWLFSNDPAMDRTSVAFTDLKFVDDFVGLGDSPGIKQTLLDRIDLRMAKFGLEFIKSRIEACRTFSDLSNQQPMLPNNQEKKTRNHKDWQNTLGIFPLRGVLQLHDEISLRADVCIFCSVFRSCPTYVGALAWPEDVRRLKSIDHRDTANPHKRLITSRGDIISAIRK